MEDGVNYFGDWRGDLTRVMSENCVHFDLSSPIWLDLDSDKRPILSLALQYKQNVTITVHLAAKNKVTYLLKYMADDFHLKREGNVIALGYGSNLKEGQWKYFTRNLQKDIAKGVGKKTFAKFTNGNHLQVTSVQFEGVGCVTNISISNQESLKMFSNAADWLVKNQDTNGGWPVDVVFNKDKTKVNNII